MSNANTYSGGTTVNAGAFLYLLNTTPSGAGTGAINLTALGANGAASSGLVVDGVTYANDITGAGYIHNNANSGTPTTRFTGNLTTSGPFIFRGGTGTTYDFAGDGTTSALSGVIGSTTSMVNGAVTTGSIVKSGTGTLTLSGANIYTGTTSITGGTLALGASNVLPDVSPVTIGAATIDAATFTDNLGTLDVAGAATINLGSGATLAFADSNGTWTGTLNITGTFVSGSSIRFGTNSSGLDPAQLALITLNGGGGPFELDINGYLIESVAGGYSAWAATNAPTGTAGDDFDGDGVTNGVEYVLGGDKDTNDASKLPAINTAGGNLTFTFFRDQASIDGTTIVEINTSLDLTDWTTTYTVPDGAVANNPGVTVEKDTPTAGIDKVTLTIPQAPDTRKFARLKVKP